MHQFDLFVRFVVFASAGFVLGSVPELCRWLA